MQNELAEGFWDSERYQFAVELYNDGGAWHFDLLKVYFNGDYKGEKVVVCPSGSEGKWLYYGEHLSIE